MPVFVLPFSQCLTRLAREGEFNRGQMDIERIKAEASLGFRLLRYLNSPAFPLIVAVRPIPHAVSWLGERDTRKWVSLIAVACMADGKPLNC